MHTLYYFYDPMCSWCYAFDHTLTLLEQQLPATIRLEKVLGGLAPDSSVPMTEPMKQAIQANWERIENTVPGIKFNYQFWDKNQPFRSTYPSCRAVLAAKLQGQEFEDKMIKQIQLAYYKNAENPSLDVILTGCAGLIGLDKERFIQDYKSPGVEQQLLQQIEYSRQSGVNSYPSLRLQIKQQLLIIEIDYHDVNVILEQLVKLEGE